MQINGLQYGIINIMMGELCSTYEPYKERLNLTLSQRETNVSEES